MRKVSLALIPIFIVLFVTNTIAQTGMVINLASRYMSLLKTNKNHVVYQHDNFEEITEDHLKIAIIPFVTQISYLKEIPYDEEIAEQQFENQLMLGKMFQEQFWDVFDNYKSDIDLQDVRITNKILQDIGYFLAPSNFPPSYLAKLLEVDAVLLCTYDIEVDNTSTPWQNFTKAFSSFAMSNLKGSVPGLSALKYISNPKLVIDIATNPGNFIKKLKAGDISDLVSLTGNMLPDGNWSKVVEIAAKNSKTIANVAKGNTSNLIQDLISNNASFLNSELKLSPQLVKTVQNNASNIGNVLKGNTEGLLYNIVSTNLNAVTEKYVANKSSLLSNAITNNATTLAKLASGNTDDILKDVLTNNISSIPGFGDEKVQKFTNLIKDNPNVVNAVIDGDYKSLATDYLKKELLSKTGQLEFEGADKIKSLLGKENVIEGLLNFSIEDLKDSLADNGLALLGEELLPDELTGLQQVLMEKKGLIDDLKQNGVKEFFFNNVANTDGFFAGKLVPSELGDLKNLIESKGSFLKKTINGKAEEKFGSWISTVLDGVGDKESLNMATSLLKSPENMKVLLQGDAAGIKNLLNTDNMSIVESIINQRHKLNNLVNLDAKEDFSILSKTNEDLDLLAYNITSNSKILNNVISGKGDGFVDELSGDQIADSQFLKILADSMLNAKNNLSNVVVNSKINHMLLNDMIDIQFFDFGQDALLESYENVSLRDKSALQTFATILDPKADPKDKSKMSINIFAKDHDEILWQYIYNDDNTRISDMSKVVSKVISRLNKSFPYFIK